MDKGLYGIRDGKESVMIEEYIPAGYEHRVSRGYLHEIMHIPDRQVRLMIADARERGILIASCDGGYFQYRDERDDPYFLDYMRKEDKRFRSQSHANKMRRQAWMRIHPEVKDNQIPGQLSMFEV